MNINIFLELKKSSFKFQSLSETTSSCENHDSVSKIKENNIIQKEFYSKRVSSIEVKKIIKSLGLKNLSLAFAFQLVFRLSQ